MARPNVVVSVDWDYFFPNCEVYDWGHFEGMPLMYDMMWGIRASNRGMMAKSLDDPMAIDSVWPEGHEEFWDEVMTTENLERVFLAESHAQILDVLGRRKDLVIHNFDAHHDLGYEGDQSLNCGNWGLNLMKQRRVKAWHQYYPAWRKDAPEASKVGQASELGEKMPPVKVRYEKPLWLEPNIVFVCRSSCWTPSWADKHWMSFYEDTLEQCPLGTDVTATEFVMKPRDMTEEKCHQMAKEQDKMLREQMASKKK